VVENPEGVGEFFAFKDRRKGMGGLFKEDNGGDVLPGGNERTARHENEKKKAYNHPHHMKTPHSPFATIPLRQELGKTSH
jgi:hypothetical protein